MNYYIEHHPSEHRWVLVDATQQVMGEVMYAITDDAHWRIRYVEVHPVLQGLGWAKQLVDAIYAHTQTKTIKLSSSCSYATVMLSRKRHTQRTRADDD